MSRIIRKNWRTVDSIACALLAIALCGLSCSTRMEGCLDVAAANFDLDADRPCDDCCRYPPVILSLSQKWGDTNFNTDSLRFDTNNRPFLLLDIRYVLSAFSWNDAEGNVYTIDSALIACEGITIPYTPDIVVIEPMRFQYTLDSIDRFPVIDEIKFRAGCLMDFDCVDAAAQLPSSVFSDNSVIWDSVADTRAAMRIILQRDPGMQSPDTIFIHTCQTFEIPYDLAFVPGAMTRLDVTVDYAQWFSEVDVTDLNSFIDSVISNLQGSFYRTP